MYSSLFPLIFKKKENKFSYFAYLRPIPTFFCCLRNFYTAAPNFISMCLAHHLYSVASEPRGRLPQVSRKL